MSKYRKSVIVNVVRPTKHLMLGDFSKIVFLTDEIDFGIKRYTTLEEVKTDFGATSKIYAGIEVFMSQADLELQSLFIWIFYLFIDLPLVSVSL